MRWFSPSSKNTTQNYNTTIDSTSQDRGKGHGNFQGSENAHQQTGSDRSVVGNKNRQNIAKGNSVSGEKNRVNTAKGHSTLGSKNRVNTSSGFSNAGTVEGRGNVQNVGRGDAFQGADMSRQNAKGDISHIGDHSSIGGDFYNRDFDLELNAAPGATINYEVGDSGVSEAITDLARSLGHTSTGGIQALDNSISGQQKVEISKEILYAIVAGVIGTLMLRK